MCKVFCESLKQCRNPNMPICAAVGSEDYGSGSHTVVCTSQSVFSFGTHSKGRLGHGRDAEISLDDAKCALPTAIRGLAGKKVVAVAAGSCHTAVCTLGGHVYTFGNNEEGQLGHGGREVEWEPRLVEGLIGKNVVAVAAGISFTFVCTSEGDLYRSGAWDGRCDLMPRLVEGLVGKKVAAVAAGGSHAVVCTSEGELYTFGRGLYGQLGHGTYKTLNVPRTVKALVGRKVVRVAASDQHTVVCTSEGETYTFGWGLFGRLGHGERTSGNYTLNVPRLVQALVGRMVVAVAACSAHTLVCTSEGALYTFGMSSLEDTLGHGDFKEADPEHDNIDVPRLVEALADRKVVGLATGSGNHSVVWTNHGQVYTFGIGCNGQLGHGDTESLLVPRALNEDWFEFN